MGKVGVATTRRQIGLPAALLLALHACGPDAARTVLVEADTTGSSVRAVDFTQPPQGASELAVTGIDSTALERGSAGNERGEGRSDPGRSGSGTRPVPGPPRSPGADAGEAEDRRGGAANREEAREPGRRPPPPILLPSGRVLLPSGTVLAAELRTPLHTATTLVGDRFAARLTQAVAAGGRIVIPVGALVEGRVSYVGNASEPGTIAFLRLEARKILMAEGRRVRFQAEVLDVTGQEVVERGTDRRGAEAGAPGGTGPTGAADARRSMLDSILIGLAGRAIVARTSDKEIIVPTGTTFTLELVEPLEIPPP